MDTQVTDETPARTSRPMDVAGFKAVIEGHLDAVSLVLCRVDAQLSRLAEAVRSRGFAIAEPDLPLAS